MYMVSKCLQTNLLKTLQLANKVPALAKLARAGMNACINLGCDSSGMSQQKTMTLNVAFSTTVRSHLDWNCMFKELTYPEDFVALSITQSGAPQLAKTR